MLQVLISGIQDQTRRACTTSEKKSLIWCTQTLKYWPVYTILRGQVMWDQGAGGLVGKKGQGQFLRRGTSALQGSRSEAEWDVTF